MNFDNSRVFDGLACIKIYYIISYYMKIVQILDIWHLPKTRGAEVFKKKKYYIILHETCPNPQYMASALNEGCASFHENCGKLVY